MRYKDKHSQIFSWESSPSKQIFPIKEIEIFYQKRFEREITISSANSGDQLESAIFFRKPFRLANHFFLFSFIQKKKNRLYLNSGMWRLKKFWNLEKIVSLQQDATRKDQNCNESKWFCKRRFKSQNLAVLFTSVE